MPCEFCPDDGDEKDCWNCSREPHDPRPVTPPGGSPYYDGKADGRAKAAVVSIFCILGVLLAMCAGIIAGLLSGWK